MSGERISTFRERIAELVESSGRTQTAIAADFGISKQTLSAWITGQNSPRTPIVYALSFYFDVSVPWLMGFDVEKRLNSQSLTQEENELLSAYRAAEDTAQRYALEMLLAHPRADAQKNRA